MPRALTITAFAALGALNAVLVPAALRPPPEVAPAPSTSGQSARETPWADPRPVSGGRGAAAPRPAPPEPPLDILGAHAMRAIPGSCARGGARLERSGDGGRTWRAVRVPATSIYRLRVVDASSAWFVGAGRDCAPRFYRTVNGGRTWAVRRSTHGAWYRLPDPAARAFHAPSGRAASPCRAGPRIVEVVGVTVGTGAVLCTDGAVHHSLDRGASWRRGGPVPGARALAFGSAQVGYAAVTGHGTCAGVRVYRTADGGRRWSPVGCAAGAPARAPISIAFAHPRSGLLVAGGLCYATSDGGRSWRRLQ